jgi:N-acylglucosamine-6-phosphate 2-epimerase
MTTTTAYRVHPVLAHLKGQLIVSVQATQGEALAEPEILIALCQSVLDGGASGLRLADLQVIKALRHRYPSLPIIGLTKPEVLPQPPDQAVYITPTLTDVQALITAGASIVAMDATLRPRPAESLSEIVSWTKERAPEIALMADVDCVTAGQQAMALGFDCIGSTLAGYTTTTLNCYHPDEPDWETLADLVSTCSPVPIIAEGRIWTPQQAQQAQQLGVFSVVVGSAITRPHLLTQRFKAALTV